ncbi:phosphoenolpyruvate--protein phosphotransferase [Methylophilaceae bacterium]|jgi:phosphotransferase system enzyme I (PtsI)|nr:phosphoenolpyruvate--protein phosphotransferase [Methylophilaceae bacterium]|tara:strand:- start:10373 stop:12097 length:1725 start_codon:yes stop_codon:yes gene_type:complete
MSSFNIHGVPVSNGIAIGKAHLISNALLEVVHYQLDEQEVPIEIKRLGRAINEVRKDLLKIKKQLLKDSSEEFSAFIDTHLMMLDDKNFSEKPIKIIVEDSCNAEWALKKLIDFFISKFDQVNDEYIKERKNDVIQVIERILKVLLGYPNQLNQTNKESSKILVAHDISPADALQFKNHQYAAFITDMGGSTSHTAILARSLNIPSIVALQNARDLIKNNEQIIVDGNQGIVIINPSKDILEEYLVRQNLWGIEQKKLSKIKNVACKTLNNEEIELLANIEVPGDIESVKFNRASGIGLFRTEFLFMNRKELPNEEEQFEIYKALVKSMKGKTVVIRTLDSGADKLTSADTTISSNPALGLRAIRLCLSEPQLFNIQLRAILKASRFGKIKILIPMLSSLSELRQTKLLIQRAKKSLSNERILFDDDIQIGGMIEVPAVAINADAFAQELDFLSIGTNDLIQYTLAIDRTDDRVSHLYNSLHPAILKLINITIKAGKKYNKEVSICGEMAGDSKLTKLLLGMGLRHFSMHPSRILSVKKQVLNSNTQKLEMWSAKILKTKESENIETLIQKINQ